MGDVVTRFRLETTQFDSKLRDASKELSQLARDAQKAGADFETWSKESIDAARALGKVESGATNLKDKLRDLTSAYNNVAKAYNELTDEQKKSDFGKAMAESLQTLQGRITQTKNELYSTGGALSELAKKFTINIDAVKLLNIGLDATKSALSVAKDAFFASEQNIDEWGRIVASSRALYDGFLNALNTGDISGYLSRIDEIVNAARRAYDELDKLSTLRTIQSPEMSRQQAENDRIRMMLRTGRGIEAADGSRLDRVLGIKNGQQLSPEVMRILEKALESGMNNTVQLVSNEVAQSGKAIDAVYQELSLTLGMSLEDFRKGTSSWAEFSKKMQGFSDYQQWNKEAAAKFAAQGGQGYVNFDKTNPYIEFKKWGTFKDDGERFKNLVALIVQRDQQMSQMYNMQGQAYQTMNRVEGITVRGIMGGGGGRGGAANSEKQKIEQVVTDSRTQLQILTDQLKTVENSMEPYAKWSDDWVAMNEEAQNLRSKIASAGLTREQLEMMVLGPSYYLGSTKKQQAKVQSNDLKKFSESLGTAQSIQGGVQGILGGIQQLGVDIPKGFSDVLGGIQGIMSITQGITSILLIIQALNQVQTTASTLDAFTPFARGGVVRAAGGYTVPGNYGYDAVPSLLTSGELVLNRAQQGNLLAQLGDNRVGYGGNAQPYVDGERIWLGMSNYLNRRGMGEIVTSRRAAM